MSEKLFLGAYEGQSIDELLTLENEYRVDSLIVALVQALESKEAPSSETERTILAIAALEQEVNNGGFGQFFLNSSSIYTSRIVGDLDAIGSAKTSEIVIRAIAALGLPNLNPDDVSARAAEDDDELIELLDECDSAYFEAAEDIETKLFAFIKANKHQIFVP